MGNDVVETAVVVSEEKLSGDVSVCEQTALSCTVNSDEDYAAAAEFLKGVKGLSKKVTEYWSGIKKPARAAYDAILEKEKQMSTPLSNAEKIVKGKMSDYAMEKERIRREQEENLRRLAREEAERQAQAAADAESAGVSVASEAAMAVAEMMEETANTISVAPQKVSASGIAQTKTWEITSVSNAEVPVDIMGMCIRPVDTSAVMKLIKSSKGTIKIPGIEYKETVRISARS